MNLNELSHDEVEAFLNQVAKDLGFSHVGASSLTRPFSFDVYRNWLAEGLHGEMSYLESHASTKENPQEKWPRAQSAFVFAAPYFPAHPAPAENFPLKHSRISHYAQGYDYHFWLKEKLERVCKQLRDLFPEEEFLPLTDSAPVLERDLAHRAGLGWIGKNTCLIDQHNGSLFLIGEIYTSISLTLKPVLSHDFCGTCTRCLNICPTSALVSPRKLDARRCISYLTIESREIPPEELREKIGDWLFGCDLCQTVCPWNEKLFKGQLETRRVLTKTGKDQHPLQDELRWILSSSGKHLEKTLKGTPLARAGNFGLKRNALIVSGNLGFAELIPEIENLKSHPKLGELAVWTIEKLKKLPVS